MRGLTSNALKVIAIISMIIDHVGFYFYYNISNETYIICRIIGRIAMPIFVFLLVQGYMHTHNIKRYMLRLMSLAIITQVCILLVRYVNLVTLPTYVTNIFQYLNIVFSFVLTLVILCMLDKNVVIISNIKRKIDKILEIVIRTIVVIVVLVIYFTFRIDYGIIVPLMAVFIYLFEKVKENNKIKGSNIIYTIGIFFTIFLCGICGKDMLLFMILAYPFILLYNGKLGKNSLVIKECCYIIFPVQHVLLYLLAIILNASSLIN